MKYVIGNWKMNTTVSEAVALIAKIEDGLFDQARGTGTLPTVVVCPPFISLSAMGDVLDERTVRLGAQNCHWADHGAYTGEISVPMLKNLGVEYVLVGHSERRRAGETDAAIAKKVAAVVRGGLVPVICVGEAEATDIATDHTEQELREALSEVDPASLEKLLVAYEPVWAVGTGNPADPTDIGEVIAHLAGVLDELGVKDADVLYGGSVTKDNIANFLAVPDLQGFLVGEASLDSQEFLSIVSSIVRSYEPK